LGAQVSNLGPSFAVLPLLGAPHCSWTGPAVSDCPLALAPSARVRFLRPKSKRQVLLLVFIRDVGGIVTILRAEHVMHTTPQDVSHARLLRVHEIKSKCQHRHRFEVWLEASWSLLPSWNETVHSKGTWRAEEVADNTNN
jgi:hypothetical protein